MIRNSNQCYVAGTSALKPYGNEPSQTTTARIVKLPRIERVNDQGAKPTASKRAAHAKPRQQRLKSILDGSEMFCSLVAEDFRGCRYNLFSKSNVSLLATAGTAIAVISLVFGA